MLHDNIEQEIALLTEADRRARAYTAGIGHRPVFPSSDSLEGLSQFEEELPARGLGDASTLALLDDAGSPAAVESNGSRYFGFVVGATLPVAAAADRLVLAWDNGALGQVTSPVGAAVEKTAARWLLEILDLPRESAVGFVTSATSGTLIALASARRTLLARHGWDLDRRGLRAAPPLRIVTSALVHVVVKKALRVLGFGTDDVIVAPVDEHGRIDPAQMPELDERTIVILQAGEVNTGEFDPFSSIIPAARAAGAWVHVDGAFGLWARASAHAALTVGVDAADSWTVDGHKWLNTPYDSAMVIVRDASALTATMTSDATYTQADDDAQRNRTMEFSRRARGVPVWAALRALGRDGVADLIERTTALASHGAAGLRAAGYTVVNRVVLNQIIAKAATPQETLRITAAAQSSGAVWFGTSRWQGDPVMRISVSSWRTTTEDMDALVALLSSLRT
ncbi:pyridoxal phosphate-dependent decarboxylase family protein [Streptomyces galbus]|uniref:Aspartate aminotransferase family protein n=1 Tax=Streptomyces galbus TaxID=33898 RepID=A0A4U5WZG9_STRGB|nr:aminotransferase class V-fold PLP-dependent enzyme [Streptomyces galbus]TKT08044.1 aspartate aminotransferase family protein [Streptomyces galbus]GHD42394.1 aspartate aminotransferase family protein [Streptomyces galbus]